MKLENVQSELKKKHGDKFVTEAEELGDVERLPTGLYPFDFASGGGFPRGKASIIWGAESTGKTNLLLKAIAANQRLEPDKRNVFIDVEHSFDKRWAKKLGVNTKKLVLFKPDYGEQTVDIVQACIQSEDIGILGIDSIAAMVPVNEQDSTAEKVQVGGNALLVSKMVKKIILELSRAQRADSYPTLIMLNQLRMKIGVMFGNPETQPGGIALKHFSGLTVRTRGKDIVEKSIDDKRPAYKEMSGVIEKFKVPILGRKFEFMFPVIQKGGLEIGKIDCWNTINAQLKDLGWMEKTKTGVNCMGVDFRTQKDVRQHFEDNPTVLLDVQQQIITAFMDELYGQDS